VREREIEVDTKKCFLLVAQDIAGLGWAGLGCARDARMHASRQTG
jgi:hypothetical protein